jgi:hypothetical protein
MIAWSGEGFVAKASSKLFQLRIISVRIVAACRVCYKACAFKLH